MRIRGPDVMSAHPLHPIIIIDMRSVTELGASQGTKFLRNLIIANFSA